MGFPEFEGFSECESLRLMVFICLLNTKIRQFENNRTCSIISVWLTIELWLDELTLCSKLDRRTIANKNNEDSSSIKNYRATVVSLTTIKILNLRVLNFQNTFKKCLTVLCKFFMPPRYFFNVALRVT